LIGLFFSREPVVDARTGSRADETAALLHLALLNRGVFIAPRGIIALSTVTTETDIEYALESFRGAIAEIAR
jgi:glutamate-1-semialdehyde aminotransferase